MRTQGPSCTHSELWPRAHCMSFRLFLHSQTESSPWVCLLRPEFQHPAAVHKSRCASGAGECSEVAKTFCAGLCLFCCCTLLWATEALYLSWLISQLVRGVLRVRKPLFFHHSLSGLRVSSKLLLLLLFGPIWLCGDLSSALVVWDLPVFNRHFVKTFPCINIFLVFL